MTGTMRSRASSPARQLQETVDAIAEWQLPNGMIPWFPGGHADPWNHVEAAMALALGDRMRGGRAGLRLAGRPPAARRLLAPVLPGRRGRAGQARRQRHRLRRRRRVAPLAAHQGPGLPRDAVAGRRPRHRASCSTCRPSGARSSGPATPTARRGRSPCSPARRASATACAARSPSPTSSATSGPTGRRPPRRLAHVIRTEPDAFAPKHRWAMDWYYPVLAGVLPGDEGRERLAARLDAFVMEGRGRALRVRPARGSPWPRPASAPWPTSPSASGTPPSTLFGWAQQYREPGGRYWTGTVYPEGVHFPGGEQSTYTAAVGRARRRRLSGAGPASELFVDHDAVLPSFDDASELELLDWRSLRAPARDGSSVPRFAGGCAPRVRLAPLAFQLFSRCVVGRARPLLCVVGMANCLRGTRGTPTAGEWASTSLVREPRSPGRCGRAPGAVTALGDRCGRPSGAAQHPERAGRRHLLEATALERAGSRSRTAGGRRRPGPGTRRGCTAGRPARRGASSARSRGGPARSRDRRR